MKRVLVTGSSGQVGSRLMKKLPLSEFDIYAVSSNVSKPNADLAYTRVPLNLLEDEIDSIIQEIRPELLIHLAWETKPGAFWDSPENARWFEASKRLVNSFNKWGGSKIVISGTCAEYDWSGSIPLTESDAELPKSIYGQAKLDLLNFLRNQPTPFLWTRTFFQFGDNEPVGRLVPSVVDSIAARGEFTIQRPNDVRDYIYIDDVANIIASLILAEKEGIFNVASGTGVTMRELGDTIASITGRQELIKFRDQDEIPSIVLADISKLEKALGKVTYTPLVDAIKKTIKERATR